MKTVAQLMTSEIHVCHPGDALSRAAHILWERDCGAVPVIDEECRPVGMVTDRDICMAALTRGARLHELPVAATLGDDVVHCVSADDDLARAHEAMRLNQVRRLPVVDGEGRLTGVLSLSDLAREGLALPSASDRSQANEDTGLTLAAVTRQAGTPFVVAGEEVAAKTTATTTVTTARSVSTPAAVSGSAAARVTEAPETRVAENPGSAKRGTPHKTGTKAPATASRKPKRAPTTAGAKAGAKAVIKAAAKVATKIASKAGAKAMPKAGAGAAPSRGGASRSN